MDDTIFALSSGAPPAAIGVIRIAGPRSAAAMLALAGRLPAPRRASLATLRHDGELLDQALLLWFPGPDTELGEDMAELHLHGGRAVIDAVERALETVPGCRRAMPGEFTRRAFANGRMDLAQVEGLADLVSAETEAQRRNALVMAGGHFSRTVATMRDRILAAAASVEAILDHADEDDVAGFDPAAVAAIADDLDALLAAPPAERLRDGIRVVLAGPPNSGKSTLLNALVGREAAIVAPTAGTTRDVIEASLSIAGIPFLISDTAGLRDTDDAIEAIGVTRAQDAIAAADILLWLGSTDAIPTAAIGIHAQADRRSDPAPAGWQSVSALTNDGVAELRLLLLERARCLLPREGEVALHRRQRETLRDCRIALAETGRVSDPLLIAESLRRARSALDALLGNAGVEDMLDTLFGRFCIGK